MRLASTFAALLLATSLHAALADEASDKAAVAVAESWLVLTDAGDFAGSWKTAAEFFKSAITAEKWAEAAKSVRAPLGKVVSRKLKSARATKTLPGAPDGAYVVIQFDTVFENKKSAVETVTPMLDKDGQWRVSGYFIK